MPNDLHRRIVAKLLERYDKPFIDNVDRGSYVECMIALALGPAWVLPGGVWNAYDLEHSESGARMEVKQSARSRQITTEEYDEKPAPPSFSIALKKVLMGLEWTDLDPPRRVADIYVFAWHPVTGVAADHRRADQWEFYVVREDALPDQKTIGLKRVAGLAQPVGYGELAAAVEEARAGLASLKKDTLP